MMVREGECEWWVRVRMMVREGECEWWVRVGDVGEGEGMHLYASSKKCPTFSRTV